jgi:hypothetical protein
VEKIAKRRICLHKSWWRRAPSGKSAYMRAGEEHQEENLVYMRAGAEEHQNENLST